MFIAFLGCDGCGKSSVLEGLQSHLAAVGSRVSRGHWAPKSGRGGKGRGNADDPHGKPPRGYIPSLAKLGYLGIRWWAGWWGGLRSQAGDGILMFDRYHADLTVDPLRYRYGAPLGLARLASACMPQPDLVFYLDASAEVLLSRKQEVGLATLNESRARYLELARRNPRILVIDASRPLEQVIADVIRRMEEHQRIR
ncbi:hypothetical protein HZ994_07475 [Akkermansiaceae bacterium]|nr:hypothetical protein HZ994_07475 [Akkermansiaceae bacterium]